MGQTLNPLLPDIKLSELMECVDQRLWPVHAVKFHVPTKLWTFLTSQGMSEFIGGLTKVELKGIETQHEKHLPSNLIIVDMSNGTRLPMEVVYE